MKNKTLMILICLLFVFCIGCSSKHQVTLIYNDSTKVLEVTNNTRIEEKDLQAPVIEGYKFLGWYLEDTLFDVKQIINESITLKAKYEINKYLLTIINPTETITKEYNYGEEVDLNQYKEMDNLSFKKWMENDHEINDNIIIKNDITINGIYDNIYNILISVNVKDTNKAFTQGTEINLQDYLLNDDNLTFIKWVIEKNDGTIIDYQDSTYIVNSNVIIKAVYKEKINTSININGEVVNVINEEGTILNLKEYLKDIEGYTFKYWKINDEEVYTNEYIVNESTNILAIYEKNTYKITVTYIKINDSKKEEITSLNSEETKEYNESIDLKNYQKNIDNLEFTYFLVNDKEVTDTIIKLNNDLHISIYYKQVFYKVTFIYNGGDTEELSIQSGTKLDLNDYVKTINGWEFTGFMIDDYYVTSIVIVNDTIINVKYKEILFIVTFIYNDTETIEQEFTKGTIIDLNDYLKEYSGYSFRRWIVDDRVITTTIIKINKDYIVKAQYKDDSKVNLSNDYARHGKLSVVGPDLVDKNSNKFQLIGLSTHGLQWFGKYVNYDTFTAVKKEFRINVIRLAMYTSENGYCDGSEARKKQLYDTVVKGIEYATKLDMYVIVDWHMVGAEDPYDKNPLYYKDEAVDFFSKISAQFKDNNNILYEIMNEPNGGLQWNKCAEYANLVIPEIRKNTDAVILVGSPRWSTDLYNIQKDPLIGYTNIMYTYHFYANDIKTTTAVEDAYRMGLPVFISEHGGMDSSGDGDINYTSISNWYSVLDRLNISYVAWNLSNSPCSASIIIQGNSTMTDFSDSNLKIWGQYYKKWTSAKANVVGS